MNEHITGSQIVANITGGRNYRHASVAGVQRWADSLPASSTMERVSRVEWIGEAWDGTQDVMIGDLGGQPMEVVKAREVRSLLGMLRKGMATAVTGTHALPDDASVRICIAPGGKQALTIDFDLGDFIFPACIDYRGGFGREEAPSISDIAGRMLLLVGAADAARETLARREADLRRALEETAERIGDGAAPLWLRMEPIAFYEDRRQVRRRQYVMLLVTLNADLVWAPTGSEQIFTIQDVRNYHRHLSPSHRARAATLRRMIADRTTGYVSDVAAAFMREHDLDVAQTFQQARDAALLDRRGWLEFDHDGRKELLYLKEGILSVSLAFEGGAFHADTLCIWGEHEQSAARALKGSRLGDLVAHPVLAASGVIVDRAQVRPGALDLFVKDAFVTLEEAQGIGGSAAALSRAA